MKEPRTGTIIASINTFKMAHIGDTIQVSQGGKVSDYRITNKRPHNGDVRVEVVEMLKKKDG